MKTPCWFASGLAIAFRSSGAPDRTILRWIGRLGNGKDGKPDRRKMAWEFRCEHRCPAALVPLYRRHCRTAVTHRTGGCSVGDPPAMARRSRLAALLPGIDRRRGGADPAGAG